MIKFNGKPFNGKDFEKAMMKEIVKQVKNSVHGSLSSIRHPDTGEFPTAIINGDSLDNLTAKIEGSPELLEFVKTRINQETEPEATQALLGEKKNAAPKVFLSFAYEDQILAEKIAIFLQSNGIDTWWAEWCIRPGDSLRQMIDEGLKECTHFIALLTPTSVTRPWVNQEMDAGLVKKLNAQCKFIAIRYNFPARNLPPLLSGQNSPEIKDETFEKSMAGLVNDIHGITRKPSLGPAPAAIAGVSQLKTGYSAAASAVAKVFVDKTTNATWAHMIDMTDLCNATGMPEDDVKDALYELGDLVDSQFGSVVVKDELYVVFDSFWKGWDPAIDALRIATDLMNDDTFPNDIEKIAQLYNWEPRRINPAVAFLVNRQLIRDLKTIGSAPWIMMHIEKTDATRRFVKSRQV